MVVQRTGMFWDGVAGRAPIPPAARTLGFELLDADPDAGSITVAFAATEAFTNPFGEVLGGFLAAMLYDTVGPALLATFLPVGSSRRWSFTPRSCDRPGLDD